MLANQVHFFNALEFLTNYVFVERHLKAFLFGISGGVSADPKSYALNGIRKIGALVAKNSWKVMVGKEAVAQKCA